MNSKEKLYRKEQELEEEINHLESIKKELERQLDSDRGSWQEINILQREIDEEVQKNNEKLHINSPPAYMTPPSPERQVEEYRPSKKMIKLQRELKDIKIKISTKKSELEQVKKDIVAEPLRLPPLNSKTYDLYKTLISLIISIIVLITVIVKIKL